MNRLECQVQPSGGMLPAYLHHTLLSFPLALLVTAAALLLVGRLGKVTWMRTTGGVCLVLGVLAGIAAATAGLLAAHGGESIGLPDDEIHEHRNAALVAVGVALVASVLWLLRRETAALIVAIAAAGAVGYAAHQGGTMLHPRLQLDRVFGEPERVAPERPAREPRRFVDQVERGEALYSEHCASCHGDAGQGTERVPPLVGPEALPPTRKDRDARFDTALDVLRYAAETMPTDDPGSLRAGEYEAIIAWVLRENDLEPLLDRDTADGVEL